MSKGNETKSVKKSGKKRKKIFIIAGIALVLLIVVRMAACSGAAQAGAIVTTASAVRGDLQESISTSGTVKSEVVKAVFAPVNGRLAQVNVEAGDAVKAGELLIAYDMDKLAETLQESKLQLEKSSAGYDGTLAKSAKSQTELGEAQVNLNVLKQQIADNKAYLKSLQDKLEEYLRENTNALSVESVELQERLKNLTPGTEEYNSVSSALAWNSNLQQNLNNSDYVVNTNKEITQIQERIAEYEEYKAKMEAQKSASESTVLDSYSLTQYDADYELAKMSYQAAEENYNTASDGIRADFDGIVTSCSAVEGEGVSEGMQLLVLQSCTDLKIAFDASKYDIQKLALGQKADVVISGRTYSGQVSKINRMAEPNASNTPMVGVEIHLQDGDDSIILGLDAKLTIYTDKTENALLVPVEAINADREGDFLYVVENGLAVRRPVVCGISTDTYTEILEGITEEDVIILNALTNLEEGMPVTVMPLQ